MGAQEAIAIANTAESTAAIGVSSNEPQGLRVGDIVAIHPDVDGGEQAVTGTVRLASADTIAIDRDSEESGSVCVHFPRQGYRVETL